ncbi:MAG: hypothetical protein SFW66_04855 [Gammaproteobacteria bacterium]|nr:hypothetical protein [Gammaproteobacteria bacterium]
MAESKHVLLVTNGVNQDEINHIRDAFEQAKQQGMSVQLQLVHVIPSLPACYFNIPSMVMLAEHYYDEATQVLTSMGQSLGVAKKDQWLITGRIRSEVLRLASQLGSSFILAGGASIKDLHQSFLPLKKSSQQTPVKSIQSFISTTA